MRGIDRFFGISSRGSTVATEIRGGVTSFLTMAYILVVNPQILSQAGMPAHDVAVATALASAAATLVMGLWAGYPFALAPGMGLNAYFTFGIVQGMGVSWQIALGAVFVEGVLFILLTVTGLRSALISAIPWPVKVATTVGIGLFLAMIGLQSAGVVVDHPSTLVSLGDLSVPSVLLAVGGLLLISALIVRKVPGGILIGIAGVAVVAWLTGIAEPPGAVFSAPHLPTETLMAFDLSGLWTGKLLLVVAALFFIDVFNTAGTLVGVGHAGGFLDENGDLPRADRAFFADAVGTAFGAIVGTSTVTSYIESATGVEDGARTGLSAVTIGVLFLLAIPFAPLLAAIPAVATAPALIAVGGLMMTGVRDLDWSDPADTIPGFLTLVLMPLTYSIATGIAFGMISWVALRVLGGRRRDVSAAMWIVCLFLVLFFVLG